MELSFEPHIGDTISFLPSVRSGPCPAGFTATLRVTDRILAAGGDKHGLLIQLEDINVETVAAATALCAFFQKGFDLFVNVFDSEK